LFNYINSLHLDADIIACRYSQEDSMAYKEMIGYCPFCDSNDIDDGYH